MHLGEPNNSELFNPGPKFGIKQKKPMTKEVLSTNSSSTSTVSYVSKIFLSKIKLIINFRYVFIQE